MSAPVGLYARISDDQDGGGLGVARQEQDCRRLADLRGWDVLLYFDLSVSAYKLSVKRGRRSSSY
jgi:site-specific DNA recombinase